MDEQLKQLLIEAAKKTESGIDKSIDFIRQQAPDIIHQLLVWRFTISLLFCILGAGIVSGGIILGVKAFRFACKHEKTCDGWDDKAFFTGMPAFIITAFGCAIFFSNFDWLQILVAPKIYLIEYATHLLAHK